MPPRPETAPDMTKDLSNISSPPLGAHEHDSGLNFSLFSAHAETVTLCLFSKDGTTEVDRIELSRGAGDIWHGSVKGLTSGQLYGYRVDGPYAPHEGHRFNPHKLLIDPYAKALQGGFIQDDALYGYTVCAPDRDLSFDNRDSAPFMPKCVAGTDAFNWRNDTKPQTDWADTIIYEAHVKGLTQRHPLVKPARRGTLSGLSDPAIIDHLKTLGVTAIELLPVHSFFSEPRLTAMGLTNYWGYNSVNFFALHPAYSAERHAFQKTVKALHKAGIEVILDVVYNHTAESWELGPTLSYRGIDNKSYYRLKDDKRYYINDTGCGNTLNTANPQVLKLTVDSLRYWTKDMHVDGFRFDLAPALGRVGGGFDPGSAFFKSLQNDPVLSGVKLIAEPWDIGPNGYQLGNFPPNWSEWNDQYRDDVRSFWRGDDGAHQKLAGRLLGSAESFDKNGRSPRSTINLITAHDGFSLEDVVSYNNRHNRANGEGGRDGHSHNLSDNMGHEGRTDNPDIIAVRRHRKKAMLATLMLSQGVPMLLAGDALGHTRHGNNNAYCQDNEITWLDWEGRDEGLQDFTAELIALRKAYPHFTQNAFLHGEAVSPYGPPNIEWLSQSGNTLHTHEWGNPALACFGYVLSMPGQDSLAVIINRGEACHFEGLDGGWTCLLTSSNDMPHGAIQPARSVSVFKYSGAYYAPEKRAATARKQAADYGILPGYHDIGGNYHQTGLGSQTALLSAMGVSAYSSPPPVQGANTDTEINSIYGAQTLREDGAVWGLTASLYGLRSARNWGIGDFEDLARLCEIMANKGADFVGINPVHALFPSAPHLYAPYSPSSREYLNIMHIAPDTIPEFTGDVPPSLKAARMSELVDYGSVYAAKRIAFEAAFAQFSDYPKTHPRRKAFAGFLASKGDSLRHHAVFDALFETLPKSKQTYDGWRNFSKPYHDPQSRACQKFVRDNKDRVEFYAYLQWIAHEQLSAAQARAKRAGMRAGLYLDFAVGVVPGGSDTWRYSDAFAQSVSLGAPGDQANPDGQKWNLSPIIPHYLTAHNYEPLRSALASVMDYAGAVRIDHILGLQRSFWIPQSHDCAGAYIAYPFEGLTRMISEESHAASCIVFGEDLGTVPEGFRDKMQACDMMGCGVHLIERESGGHIQGRSDVRRLSLTGYSNHDFPTLAGFWAGADFRWRETLGIGNNPAVLDQEKQMREADKARLASEAGAKNTVMNAALMARLQAYLAGAPCLAFAVQLDDIMLEPHQANVPGTTDEQPNWRRRARLSLEDLERDKTADLITRAINQARNNHAAQS